jgi:hypothetical protein
MLMNVYWQAFLGASHHPRQYISHCFPHIVDCEWGNLDCSDDLHFKACNSILEVYLVNFYAMIGVSNRLPHWNFQAFQRHCAFN